MSSAQLIAQLQENRAKLKRELEGLMVAPKKFNRDLSANESKRFREITDEIEQFDDRITELTERDAADEAAATVSRRYFGQGASITSEPQVYRKGGQQSFFRDAYQSRQYGDRDAFDRLMRNNAMVADAKATARGEQRAISTTNGAGGELVPPLWLENELIALARPARTTADLATRNMLPGGTDIINIPKVNTGTAVAAVATQNTGILQQDMTTTSVSSPVITIAGGQTVSLQLMEQSPLNVDDVILADLAHDYAMKWDLQVLNGTGANGQVMGLLNLAGTTAIAWTQASPSLGGAGGMYAKIAAAISGIHSSRYAPATAIVMHPRRWAWAESQSDSQNRPLIVPTAGNPMNAAGTFVQDRAEGAVGMMLGLPVYIDANIPTNLGTGTNQDAIIVTRAEDQYAWEGEIRAEAFQQTYAASMAVMVRLYNYAAYIPGRYAQSIAIITGSGAVPPVF